MEYVNDTPLEVGHRVWQLRPPQPSLTVLVKGTFEPTPEGPVRLAAEQLPPTAEVFYDDDVERSLRVPSDFALLKPQGECMVVGKAYSARPTRALTCSFRVGSVRKQFAVVGDRRWEGRLLSKPSEPEPFTEMDLSLERAYGGPGHDANPFGAGRVEVERDGQRSRPLPNLEQPHALVDSPSSAPPPLIVGPRPQSLAVRRKLAGTYDRSYVDERWPWLPRDFDWRYFLEAPPDQWIEGFWRGDEPIELRNLHPTISALAMELPAIRPRVCVEIRARGDAAFTEVPANLDTIVWDAEHAALVLVWRGVVEVPSESLEEIPRLFVTSDRLDAPRSLEALRARFDSLLHARGEEERQAEGTPPPAFSAPTDFDDDAPQTMMASFAGGQADEASAGAEELAAAEATFAALSVPALPEPAGLPSAGALLESLRSSGKPAPRDLEAMLEELDEAERRARGADFDAEPRTVFDPMAGPPVRDRIKGRVEQRESLRELDLSGADLSRLDLAGHDLTGAILRDALLVETNLEGANLSRAVLAGADLQGAVLRASNLTSADLTGARAARADFTEATLEDALFDRAILRRALLCRVRAARASFVRADLEEARLYEGDFLEADFERARLVRADVARCRLTDATLELADASEARFDGSEMIRSRGEALVAKAARFRAVVADDSYWEHADLSRADFGGARLDRADFSSASLIGAVLDRCSSRQARFDGARAHGMRAREADLFEASFASVDLRLADLRGANLYCVELWRAVTDQVQLDQANVAGTLLAR